MVSSNISSDNGLSPSRHRVTTWTTADVSSIVPPGTNFRDIATLYIYFQQQQQQQNVSKMWSAKCPPIYPALGVITYWGRLWVRTSGHGSLVHIMACRLFGTKPLPEPMPFHCLLDTRDIFLWHFIHIKQYFTTKCISKSRLHNGNHFIQFSTYSFLPCCISVSMYPERACWLFSYRFRILSFPIDMFGYFLL